MTAVSKLAVRLASREFRLDLNSNIHGRPHWVRVARNGAKLARLLGVRSHVPEWFAYLHDSQRANDNRDPMHGSRAAAFAWSLAEQGHLKLSEGELYQLQFALATHSDGWTSAPELVQICWDADRLDLPRVGILPDPRRMCTRPGAALAAEIVLGMDQCWKEVTDLRERAL